MTVKEFGYKKDENRQLDMIRNFKLTIEYDGTNYHGWQRQKWQISIQQTIEQALEKITQSKINLTGAGRTDARVHALAQVANFSCNTKISARAFQKGLNSLLPPDIVILECVPVNEAFHARYDVKSKIYHYRILNQELASAINRKYVWHISKKLDINSMHNALPHIIGNHDFKAFQGAGSPRPSTIRHIMSAAFVQESSNQLVFKIQGNGFLRFMVRNIVSTLVCVGLGKLKPDDLLKIRESRDRANAGPTAPPHGLFLVKVLYKF